MPCLCVKPVKINAFLGIRNTNTPRSIPDGALADAQDIDVSDTGVLIQRPGYTLSKALPVDDAYSTVDGQAFVVTNGQLCRLTQTLDVLPVAASVATEFCDYEKVLFTNDGLMVDGNITRSLILPPPASPPVMSGSAGDLMPGTYRAVAVTVQDGMESGTSPVATFELESGGLYIGAGANTRVYLTEANGTVFYATDNGVQLDPIQMLADPFPMADKIAYHEARLYLSQPMAGGQTLVMFSKPLHFHLYDSVNDYFIVPGQVNAMMGVAGGLLVGTESAIFAYQDGTLSVLAEYGIPQGRAFARTPNNQAFIHSKRGTCKALPFENLTETKCLFNAGLNCSTAIVDMGGISRFIALNDGLGENYNPYKKQPHY